jgi:hypothetical protein
MGFTLRAALAALPPAARLTVVEIVPEIIEWARGPMAGLTAGCLDDRRVSLVQEDVAALIRQASGTYDAILLDVDNGPDGLSRAGNNALYSAGGLAAASAALKPGGILAIWSAADDPVFARRLSQAGFRVEELAVRARSNGKARDTSSGLPAGDSPAQTANIAAASAPASSSTASKAQAAACSSSSCVGSRRTCRTTTWLVVRARTVKTCALCRCRRWRETVSGTSREGSLRCSCTALLDILFTAAGWHSMLND